MGYLFEAMKKGRSEATPPAPASPQVIAHAAIDTVDRPACEPIRLDPKRLATLDERLVVWRDALGPLAEQYRVVRTSLLARCQRRRHLAHTVTSALPQEGKTFTTLNLAAALGELPDRTALAVEADLRLPQFRKLLKLGDGPGLGEVLRGQCRHDDVLQPIGSGNTWLLPAGARGDDEAAQLLATPVMAELLVQLRKRFDHVLIDTPPVNAVADAGVIGAMCDEVMLVARMEQTPVPLVRQALQRLTQAQATVAGLIATDAKEHRSAYDYTYRYSRRSWRQAA